MSTEHFLACPFCETPAIPASGYSRAFPVPEPTWCEDDEAKCPGCHEPLRANITGDDEGSQWVEAVSAREEAP